MGVADAAERWDVLAEGFFVPKRTRGVLYRATLGWTPAHILGSWPLDWVSEGFAQSWGRIRTEHPRNAYAEAAPSCLSPQLGNFKLADFGAHLTLPPASLSGVSCEPHTPM